jgi:hypothetical protein
MTTQPAGLQGPATGAEQLLFTGGPRLGWTFRDRQQLITPYTEPQPDPQAVTGQVTARQTSAQSKRDTPGRKFSLKVQRNRSGTSRFLARKTAGQRGREW